MTVGEKESEKSSASVQHDQNWSELIRRMAKGDEASLAEFYDQSSRLVFALALRIVKESAVAEAVMLDVYRQAWRQANTFNAQRDNASAWIWKIACQQAVSWLRAAMPTQAIQPLPANEKPWGLDDVPQETFMFDEQRQRIRRALPQLDQTQRALIECAFFEGLTHYEIAAKFDMSPLAVQRGIGSGMRKLRELIFNEDKGAPLERLAVSH
jgi:RNA polymerase sigma-70 factor, ECF subfamily